MSFPISDAPTLAAIHWRSRFHWAGMIILLLGIAGAEFVYWRGTTRDTAAAAEAMNDNDFKVAARNTEYLYGKVGLARVELEAALKRPGPQAVAVLGGSILVAGGCFSLAWWLGVHAGKA